MKLVSFSVSSYDQQLSPIDSAFLCLSPNVSQIWSHHNLSLNYNILIKVTNSPLPLSLHQRLNWSPHPPSDPPLVYFFAFTKVIIYNASWTCHFQFKKFLTFALRVNSHHVLSFLHLWSHFFTAVNPLAFAYLTALVWNTVSFPLPTPQVVPFT